MRILPAGRDAVLVEVDDVAQALSLATHAREHGLAREVVPGAASVLLDGLGGSAPDLSGWVPTSPAPTSGEVVTLPVVYDGPDLQAVALLWECSVEEVVVRHSGLTLVSAFCGFAPGFAYLAGLPDDLAVPRLDSPRSRVPAGSVGLAGSWCGVYPTASPGGWQLLGRTDAVLWDATAATPALLSPGTRVRFEVVS